jgi:Glutamyl-tRNAGlu reductase, dimerisation domain
MPAGIDGYPAARGGSARVPPRFVGVFPRSPGGITLAFQHRMSPMARALQHRFDEICRAELARLRRKTAALTPADREQVDAISAQVTMAIAASVGAAVDGPDGAGLHDIVSRLFAVSPADSPNAQGV